MMLNIPSYEQGVSFHFFPISFMSFTNACYFLQICLSSLLSLFLGILFFVVLKIGTFLSITSSK